MMNESPVSITPAPASPPRRRLLIQYNPSAAPVDRSLAKVVMELDEIEKLLGRLERTLNDLAGPPKAGT